MLTIRFWGVRGSVATGERRTAGVGGNTSCVEVICDANERPSNSPPGDPAARPDPSQGTHLIFDAGTGLRALGADLMSRRKPVNAHLFLSHYHWDHVQGFPFFVPAYVPGNHVSLYGAGGPGAVRRVMEGQMSAPCFPVTMNEMKSNISFHDIEPGSDFLVGGVRIRTAPARHPNGCLFYRVDHQGRSVVYATDTEHADNGEPDAQLLGLARGADVLIYDAQYTPEEYSGAVGGGSKKGWGHSTAQEGVRLAQLAGVSRLVLYHHDPSHDDAEVERIEAAARALLPDSCAAREGLQIVLEPRK
jgi:phosphoribosyl 1,2-cyclic phosphodiesterase